MSSALRVPFGAPVAALAVVLLVLFCVFTTYTESEATDEHINQYYMWYIHVVIMVMVGFGWLMTFLRRYSYSAVALNWVMSVLVMLEFILVGGAVQQLWHKGEEGHTGKIQLDIPLLIDAAFCAASAMITFGAVLGKVNPTQLMMLLVMGVPLYAINQKLVFEYFKGLDIGGSMTIHAFGAYYGLAASMLLSKGQHNAGLENTKNGSSYTTDITAMVGTIFLYIYWPSFNGALASNPDLQDLPVQTQFYCVVNTIVSLLGAVLVTFALSALYEGKLNMVLIQNATLAGGVGVGSAANLQITPGGALAIGMAAGLLSTTGFVYLTPFLERKIGLKDTCGVHNLHGMPGLMAGLAAMIASLAAPVENMEVLALSHGNRTWAYQLACLGCTLAMGILGGLLAAWIINLTTPQHQVLQGSLLFEDAWIWNNVEPDAGDEAFEDETDRIRGLPAGVLKAVSAAERRAAAASMQRDSSSSMHDTTHGRGPYSPEESVRRPHGHPHGQNNTSLYPTAH